MARLTRRISGDGDFDDSDFGPIGWGSAAATPVKTRYSPRKRAPPLQRDASTPKNESTNTVTKLVAKATPKSERRGRQIRLAPLDSISRVKPFEEQAVATRKSKRPTGSAHTGSRASTTLNCTDTVQTVRQEEPDAEYESSEAEVEESLWCGSADSYDQSDYEDLPDLRTLLRLPSHPAQSTARRLGAKPFSIFGDPSIHDLAISETKKIPNSTSVILSRPGSSSDKENTTALLRFSPPRLFSPAKQGPCDRPVTPPQSPSKSRLQSPSKSKPRVPSQQIRQSLDAFWDADRVNDWNDQYSPHKVLKSPRKLKFTVDERSVSPSGSPRKPQSPAKDAARAEREAKKAFEASKHHLAEDFLAELDREVADGEIQRLASTTGGVKFIWSKTLNTTAGRANWRKETTKTTSPDGTTKATYKHFASIELAEKVINDAHRLLNVIAHEFCHLCNFMLSGIKDQPHGRQFQLWGAKCTRAFAERGVRVTTKHSYQIDYRYVWQCSNEECGAEFKRHSKSIDPARQSCGSCRGKLVQVKPVPRRDAGVVGGGGGGYAGFVKMHFAAVRKRMPGASQKEVMEAVGAKYRAEKMAAADEGVEKSQVGGDAVADDLESVVQKLEVVVLDD